MPGVNEWMNEWQTLQSIIDYLNYLTTSVWAVLKAHDFMQNEEYRSYRERSAITWSLPGSQTRGIIVWCPSKHEFATAFVNVTKSLLRKTHAAFICISLCLQKLQLLKREEMNDVVSVKVLALTMPLWFIPFEISTLTQVCACCKRRWRPCLKSFCIQVILMSPLHLWLTLF